MLNAIINNWKTVFFLQIVDVENGTWAQYFKRQKKNMWTLENTNYRILRQDIISFLEAPDIVFTSGSSQDLFISLMNFNTVVM